MTPRPSGYDPNAYPPFAVTADVVVFTIENQTLLVALIERGSEPYKGMWALPGGFVEPDEDLASAALRELAEETGLDYVPAHLEQLGAYGDPERDPRMRVVSVAYWAILADVPALREGTDAASAQLLGVDEALADPTNLAFDHHLILGEGLERLRRAVETSPVATAFCPPEYTSEELRAVYEAILGVALNPAAFQAKLAKIPGLVLRPEEPAIRRRESE